MYRIHLQHLQLHRLPFLHGVGRILNVRDAELRHRHEALDVLPQVHHHALVHQAQHAAPQLGAHRIGFADPQPGVLLRLLQPQRDALVLGVDVQDQHLDLVAFLHDLGRVLHALGPRHVGDVDQAVDAGLDLDERPERGEVAHLALDAHAHRIFLRQRHPGIFLGLLHAERDFFFCFVDFQHDGFDRLADRDDLGRVAHVAGPAHLGDVHEAFDPRLELDERPVVGDRHDLALHARPYRILRGHVLPRVRLQLLQAEADALALPVDVEDLDFDLLADLDHLRRMRHAPVAHVGDVQQAVHAPQIDERAEIGDVLDDAFAHLTDLQLLHEDVALGLALRFEQHAPAHHDVAAALVELDDLELEALPQQLVDVGHPPQRDLAAGEERIHAHQVDHDAALDLLDQGARYRLVLLMGLADPLPHPHEVGLLLGEDHRAFLVLQVLQEDLDLVPLLERLGVLELVDRHCAFRLEADVEDDGGIGHTQHLGLDDLALLDVGERPLVQLRHLGDFVRRVFLVEIGADAKVRALSGGRLIGFFGQVFRIYQHSRHRFGCGFGPDPGLDVRNTFTGASGNTTVPMSRPSTTTPRATPATASRCCTFTQFRTSRIAAIAETWRVTRSERIAASTSTPATAGRKPSSTSTRRTGRSSASATICCGDHPSPFPRPSSPRLSNTASVTARYSAPESR